MTGITRRNFLKTTTLAAAGMGAAAVLPRSVRANPVGANDAIGVAVAGLGYGIRHARRVQQLPGARLVAVCDLDPNLLERRTAELKEESPGLFATTDFRDLLERRDVDAIFIATSNHWHALHTVWACQAGKDVYVEKPIAHTVWEGRQMIKAAEKYGRVVQAGTQARSAIGLPQVIDYLKEGHVGKMRYIHAFSSRRRGGIGLRTPWYPDDIDYDLFCGPAPMVPLERDRWRYDWHWMWDTGNGDLGNLGIHFYDRAIWVAGHGKPPPRVRSLGARLRLNDAGETPNAQFTILDYPDVPIIVENRSLPAPPGGAPPESFHGMTGAIMIQCEGGHVVGTNGGRVFDATGKLIKEFPSTGAGNHIPNFLDAVRNRRAEDLAAPVGIGHVSNTGCLLGNISARLGTPAQPGTIRRELAGALPDSRMWPAFEEYLVRMGVTLTDSPLRLGPWLEFDPENETFTGIGETDADDSLERARHLLKGTHRAPYRMPDLA